MAHYARTTPPVRPPERPHGPDQPWTGWWQPGITPETAVLSNSDTPEIAVADIAPDDMPTIIFDLPVALESGPAADDVERGGLRRVGVPPTGAAIATANSAAAAPELPPPYQAALETAATLTAARPTTVVAEATYSVEGVAQRPGDLIFAGVTFPQVIDRAPDVHAIRLTITDLANVDPDSVSVASFDGFGPDQVGFTLIAAALNPGPMWVDGHYHVEH